MENQILINAFKALNDILDEPLTDAPVKKPLNESKTLTEKQSFVTKVGKYSILDCGDRYVITKNGLNVGETKFGIPVAIDMAQEMEDEDNKKTKKEESCSDSIKEDTTKKLEPKFDSRKSFYGKARVIEKDDGSKILYSYSTPVVRIKDGKATLLRRGYVGWSASPTTLRHVKDFLAQNGFKVGSYKDLANMYPEEQAQAFECLKKEDLEKLGKDFLTEGKSVDISDEKQVKEGKDFLEDKEEETDIEQIVDVNADDVEDLKKSYVGDVILECPVCHTKVFKSSEDLVKSEEKDKDENPLYNIEDECPHCGSKEEGFVLIGQVAKLDTEEEKQKEAEDEKEPKEEEPISETPEESKPVLDEPVSDEPSEPANEELHEDVGNKIRYYLHDTVPDFEGNYDAEFSEFKTEKDFYDSLEYNHEVAVEYGDEPDPLEDIEKKFKEEPDYEEELNGFGYIKLTNKSLAEWEGMSEEELGTVSIIGEEPKPEEKHQEETTESLNEDRDTLDYEEFEVVKFDDEGTKIDSESQFFADENEAIKFAKNNNYDIVICYDYEKGIVKPISSMKVWDKEKGEKDFSESCQIEDIDENKFDNLVSQHLKESYKNVESYKTTKGKIDRQDNIVLEGTVKFANGKEKNTKFILNCSLDQDKVKIKTINENFVKARKPITIIASINDKKLICESIQ